MAAGDPISSEFNRAVSKQAASISPPPTAEQRRSETVEEKAARVTQLAEAHYEKHRDRWVEARFVNLVQKEPPAPSLRPAGTSENKPARLRKAAEYLAMIKHDRTLKRIAKASAKMSRGLGDNDLGR